MAGSRGEADLVRGAGLHGLIRATEVIDLFIKVKDVAGTRVSVATPRALYRLKKDTVRAKDREDAAALRERFGLEDEA